VIEPRDVAFEVSNLMLEMGAKLDASVALVEARCTPDELAAYRVAVSRIMGTMLLEIMNPLYARHRDLKPKQLK
jgi:hypothetical protein